MGATREEGQNANGSSGPGPPSIAEGSQTSVQLGCIADDFTGATDLANNLVRNGWPTVLCLGLPQDGAASALPPETAAVVVALKSRTIPADEAVAQSLAAWRWLRALGAQRCYFKVCSTFDSTDRGNIGPVADALSLELDAPIAVVCPAFPAGGRTVFRGHLFVGDQLLSDSGMKDHPLTPMTDSNLVRVLQRQSRHRIGLVDYLTIAKGASAVRDRLEDLKSQEVRMAIADATCDADLEVLGEASQGLSLLVAGSGLALGIRPPAHRGRTRPGFVPQVQGSALILSGSCSSASLRQVRHYLEQARTSGDRALRVDPLELGRSDETLARFFGEVEDLLDAMRRGGIAQAGRSSRLLVYATMPPEELRGVQRALGRERASALVEEVMARVARLGLRRGIRRWVVAGGETSGAVAQALQVRLLRIGSQIDPGVPWTASCQDLALALKSGNFGDDDFFSRSLDMLDAVALTGDDEAAA
jgi:uncharacterized protein YgbK (DUF1537 family)